MLEAAEGWGKKSSFVTFSLCVNPPSTVHYKMENQHGFKRSFLVVLGLPRSNPARLRLGHKTPHECAIHIRASLTRKKENIFSSQRVTGHFFSPLLPFTTKCNKTHRGGEKWPLGEQKGKKKKGRQTVL